MLHYITVFLLILLYEFRQVTGECSDGMVEIKIERIYTIFPERERISIYQGTRGTGTLIYDVIGMTNQQNMIIYSDMCLHPTLHTFVAISTSGEGWYTGSYVVLSLHQAILSRYRLKTGSYGDFFFYPYYILDTSSPWRYTSTPIPYKEWIYYSYDDSNWNYYYSGRFPTPSSITRYYRRTIRINKDISGITLLELSIKSKEGIIIYINSKLLTYHYVQNTDLSPQDYAIQSDPVYILKSYSANYNYFIGNSTDIIIAIEVHQAKNVPITNDEFEATLLFLSGDEIQRNFNGTSTSTPLYKENEIADNAFDGLYTTKWSGLMINERASLLYTFPNQRKEWINTIDMGCDVSDYKSLPKSFFISGSNDNGTTWEPIAFYSNLMFTNINDLQTFYFLSNIHLFNIINITFTETYQTSTYVSVFNINFYASNKEILQEYSYGSDSFTWFISIEKVSISPLHSGVSNYRMKSPSSLPKGLTLDSISGTISGYPTVTFSDDFIIEVYSYLYEKTITITFHVDILVCSNDKYVTVDLIKNSHAASYEYEYIELINMNDTTIYLDHAISSSAYYKTLCLPRGIYTLALSSIGSTSWFSSSNLKVSLRDDIYSNTVFYGSLHSGYSIKAPIVLDYVLNNRDSSVLCKLDNDTFIDSTWYTNDYFTSSSSPITNTWFSCLNTSSRLKYNSYNRYYRTTITIDDTNKYQGMEIILKGPNSVLLYINEQIAYKTDLNDTSIPITDNTMPSNNNTSVTIRTISLSMNYFHNGINTIAFATLYSRTTKLPYTNNVELSIHYLSSSAIYPRIWNIFGSINSTEIYNYVSALFDLNYYSIFSMSYKTQVEKPRLISLFYESKYRFEYINRYCIAINLIHPEDGIESWSFYGCDYERLHCMLLDTQEDIQWSISIGRRCFYTYPHIQSYPIYLLYVYKPKEDNHFNAQMNQLEFYIYNENSILIPELTYSLNPIIGYIGIDISTSYPNDYYISFSIIEGTLPKGLSLDTYTGIIVGIPLETTENTTIIIQGRNIRNEYKNTTLTIQIYTCISPNILFKSVFSPSWDDTYNSFSYYIQDRETKEIIGNYTQYTKIADNIVSYCRKTFDYSITLITQNDYGWLSSSISILLKDGTIVFTGTLSPSEYKKEYYFSIYSVLLSSEIQWTYYDTLSDTPLPSDWMKIDYQPIGWKTGTILNMSPPQGITQYYRMNYYFTTLQNIAVLSYTITLRGGCILYINGKEAFRYGLENISITRNTISIFDPYLPETVGGSIHLQLSPVSINIGNNTIAVEIHRGKRIFSDTIFNISLVPILKDIRYQKNGYGYTPYEDSISQYSIDNAFDNNKNTIYRYRSQCVGVSISYIYNNQIKEYINRYSISNYYLCNIYTPSGWTLEGSNDNINYTIIHQVKQQYFTYSFEEKVYSIISDIPYNIYKLTIDECENSYLRVDEPRVCTSDLAAQISEFSLFTGLMDNLCTSIDGYPSVYYGEYSYKSCGLFYTGQKKRLCSDKGIWSNEDNKNCILSPPTIFNYEQSIYLLYASESIYINVPFIDALYLNFTSFPSLPSSFSLNTATGVITSVPSSTYIPLTQYTITASSSHYNTTISTKLYISVATEMNRDFCKDDVWSRTYQGNTTTIDCPSGFSGYYQRSCIPPSTPNGIPSWSSIENHCVLSSNYIVLSYPHSSYVFVLNRTVSVEPIVTSGIIEKWSITPSSLPNGLLFNNGIISGIPLVYTKKNNYTIKAEGQYNNVTILLTISTDTYLCFEDGEWPPARYNTDNYLSCPDGYIGIRKRRCLDSTSSKNFYVTEDGYTAIKWDQEHYNCKLKSPSISMTPSYIQAVINSELYPITPLCIGICTSWSIIPSLPEGLIMNVTTGTITGIPKSPYSESIHMIIASNTDNYSYIPISITVINPQCPAEGRFPATNKGETITLDCGDLYKEGSITRICSNDYIPKWTNISDTCIYKTPVVTYPITYIVAYIQDPLIGISPNIQNYINSWTVTPDFPTGITLNTKSGVIEGTPTILSSLKTYKITASNPDKQMSIDIQLVIREHTCKEENDWPETSIGQTAYLLCTSIRTSYRTRECVRNGISPLWSNENRTRCLLPSSSPSSSYVYIEYTIYISGIRSESIQGKQIYILLHTLDSYLSVYSIPSSHIWIISLEDIYLNVNDNHKIRMIIRIMDIENEVEKWKDTVYHYLMNEYKDTNNDIQVLLSDCTITSNYDDIHIIENTSNGSFIYIIIGSVIGITVFIIVGYFMYHYCKYHILNNNYNRKVYKDVYIKQGLLLPKH
ncbi:hypothetical protein WA158_006288 [Blastocystis sp. Blastoise]